MASLLGSGSAGRLGFAGWLVLTVVVGLIAAAPAKAERFTNPESVTWNSLPTPKAWDPYPSSISVPQTDGTVDSLSVLFHGFQAGNLSYMNFMLVGPNGERAILASDMSGSAYAPETFNLGFADNGTTYPEGANYPVAGVTLYIQPVNNDPNNDTIWTAPAPSAVGATSSLATAFGGINPSGTWSLYGFGKGHPVVPATHSISSGWSLDIEINLPPPTPPSQPPTQAEVPGLTSLTISPSGFRAANIGGSAIAIGSRRRAPVGSTVLFNLSGDGTAYFKARRLSRGFRKGKRCLPKRKVPKNKRRQKCARAVPVNGGFQIPGTEGLNGFTFTGRMNGRALRPGKYRLLARASADGLAYSETVPAKFRIVR